MGVLTSQELDYLETNLRRKANEIEQDIVGAEWSEHCSYKSSKRHLRLLPTKGKRVVVGPGYDAGVLDVGDGYVVTVHIESHNHPSAVEPFGGAATGVGGVIRDIMSMGSRPIAVLDALRFAPINGNAKSSSKSKWLLKNVVKGIADYGNCIGIPTVGGEIEFDSSFEDYCLVDVASIGLAKREDIVANKANPGDVLVLAGGSTGRDGIHGASFASRALEAENRSAVQIPDPFLEKLLLEATMEAVASGCIKSIKDLGGGGLSCCLSETSDSLGLGFDVDLSKVHARESGMTPAELMISESQERMLYVTDMARLPMLESVFRKYEIPHVVIGTVKKHNDLIIRKNDSIIAHLPSRLVARAPLADRIARKPDYITKLAKFRRPAEPSNLGRVLLSMLSNPSISSKRWVYEQYDHEVGIRTVAKPGSADASILRLDRSDKLLSVKLDGNSKQCFLDPYQGTLGCLSEGRRNVISTGAEPIGVLDHLQFASPEDPGVFWSFSQAVEAIVEFCKFMDIPVVGGKVSFYNETSRGPIKPTPVIGTLGLIDATPFVTSSGLVAGDAIFIVGVTLPELGGSEYYEYVHGITGGPVPKVDLKADKLNGEAVLKLIRNGLVRSAHDCSKGGLAVALAEMALLGNSGLEVDMSRVPHKCARMDELLFSESHSRYLIGTDQPERVKAVLSAQDVPFSEIGRSKGQQVSFTNAKKRIFRHSVTSVAKQYYSLEKVMA
jgi:phosphoribosylformylglycinamidine synthase